MSITAGPKVVNNGLVFSYDMNNITKSYRGGPMTNAHYNNGSPFDPWSAGGINIDVSATKEAGPITDSKTWKFIKTGGTNQWNGWESGYGSTWTGASGDIWTTSYWYKTTAPAGNTGFGVGSFYLGDWSRPYNTTVLANQSSIIADGTWRYNYTVTQFNEAYSNAIVADGPSWGYSSLPGTLYINGLQWNKNSYAGTHVAGTRSNTQVLLDLTNTNTITASSLTYAGDGTASFNGSSNYITVTGPSLTSNMSAYTISFWAKRDAEGRMPIASLVGTGFYWYGDSSWKYQHGGVSGEYYYSKPTSIPLGTWGHYCVVYNGATVSIYRQGVFQGSQATTGAADWSGGMMIGYWQGGTGYQWQGKIDQVSMYNRPLTAAEVEFNFNTNRGRYGI